MRFSWVILLVFTITVVGSMALADEATQTVTVEPHLVDIDTDEDRVTYRPDGDIQQASYEYYHFDHDSFMSAVGGEVPDEDFELEIRVLDTTTEIDEPSDPRMASSQGGFERTHHQAEIVTATSDDQSSDEDDSESDGDNSDEDESSDAESASESPSTFDDATLAPGFLPDPAKLEGKAGGPDSVSELDGCGGYIAQADSPDHVVTLSADFQWMEFAVRSDEKTSLTIVRQEDMEVFCVDLSEASENIWGHRGYTLANSSWEAGEYRIYVGADRPGHHPDYQLFVSEIRPENR